MAMHEVTVCAIDPVRSITLTGKSSVGNTPAPEKSRATKAHRLDIDGIVKSHQMDGKAKSSKFKARKS
jgi:hypothetical protein